MAGRSLMFYVAMENTVAGVFENRRLTNLVSLCVSSMPK
jgi:hypothetical protein